MLILAVTERADLLLYAVCLYGCLTTDGIREVRTDERKDGYAFSCFETILDEHGNFQIVETCLYAAFLAAALRVVQTALHKDRHAVGTTYANNTSEGHSGFGTEVAVDRKSTRLNSSHAN